MFETSTSLGNDRGDESYCSIYRLVCLVDRWVIKVRRIVISSSLFLVCSVSLDAFSGDVVFLPWHIYGESDRVRVWSDSWFRLVMVEMSPSMRLSGWYVRSSRLGEKDTLRFLSLLRLLVERFRMASICS